MSHRTCILSTEQIDTEPFATSPCPAPSRDFAVMRQLFITILILPDIIYWISMGAGERGYFADDPWPRDSLLNHRPWKKLLFTVAMGYHKPWDWRVWDAERGMVSQYHSPGKYFVVGRTARLNVFTCTASIFSPLFLFLLLLYFLPCASFFLTSFFSQVGPLRFLFTATQFFSGKISLRDQICIYIYKYIYIYLFIYAYIYTYI